MKSVSSPSLIRREQCNYCETPVCTRPYLPPFLYGACSVFLIVPPLEVVLCEQQQMEPWSTTGTRHDGRLKMQVNSIFKLFESWRSSIKGIAYTFTVYTSEMH